MAGYFARYEVVELILEGRQDRRGVHGIVVTEKQRVYIGITAKAETLVADDLGWGGRSQGAVQPPAAA